MNPTEAKTKTPMEYDDLDKINTPMKICPICKKHIARGIHSSVRGLGLDRKKSLKVTYTSDEKDHINLASLAYNAFIKTRYHDMTYKDKKVEDILSTEAYELPSKILKQEKAVFT